MLKNARKKSTCVVLTKHHQQHYNKTAIDQATGAAGQGTTYRTIRMRNCRRNLFINLPLLLSRNIKKEPIKLQRIGQSTPSRHHRRVLAAGRLILDHSSIRGTQRIQINGLFEMQKFASGCKKQLKWMRYGLKFTQLFPPSTPHVLLSAVVVVVILYSAKGLLFLIFIPGPLLRLNWY